MNGKEKNACGNGQIGTVLVIMPNAWPLERAHTVHTTAQWAGISFTAHLKVFLSLCKKKL